MRKFTFFFKSLLVAAGLLLGSANAWGVTETYDFNSWVGTNLTSNGGQQTLTVTGDNIATADAANVKVISDISTPAAFAFNGRFATDDVTNVYLRNGNSKSNQHNVNKGIQCRNATKHFSILNLRKDDVVKIVTGAGETSFASINAKVNGVQVKSEDRVGADVAGTEVGATTVCTMTADGNLDLKLGPWAVIMSVTINEPISATLDHTAGAQWGSNTGASTVDANQEHYNGDAGSGWAGCAYARFSYTIPDGHVITSATLNYTMVQNNSSNQEDHIYYMNKDFDLDWANFAGQTGKDLRNTASRSSSYRTQPTVAQKGGGKENVLSVDVTDYVKNIAEQSQDYIIFQWTGNAGGADLYGKGADAAKRPTLVIETAPTVSVAIEDCEAHETSSEFATAVEKESFASAAEVYAFHTAWQIAQADAASSNDITKVIFDAAVSDFTRWNNARNSFGQQYTGAPDNKYFDAWNNDPSDAKQKIYGLPAGAYSLKVATRASAEVTDKSKYNVWVNGGSADVSALGNHVGDEGGDLGKGWSWTILPFTLTEKADVEIGFYSCPPTNLWAGADDWHLYKVESVSASISEYGWATFSSDYPLDFTGISDFEAYMITGHEGNVVTKSKVEGTVPAGTGLLLKGDKGDYNIPVVASSSTDVSANKLVAGTGAEVSEGGDNTRYVLGVNNNGTAGDESDDFAEFQKIGGTAATVAKGKAYLEFVGVSLVKVFNIVDGAATGVEAPVAAEAAVEDGIYYNLNGQQVTKDYKGIVIVNGKKFYNK